MCFSTICHGKVIPIATRGAQISFSQLPLKMASDRCLYCSTRVGIQILRPVSNSRRFPECITRAGSESRSSRAQGCNQYPRLKAYVQGVIGKFGNDPRVLAWNVWNEPSNRNESSYGNQELKDKERYVEILLPQVFEWALAANPSQPLTSGMWANPVFTGTWGHPAIWGREGAVRFFLLLPVRGERVENNGCANRRPFLGGFQPINGTGIAKFLGLNAQKFELRSSGQTRRRSLQTERPN